MKRASLLFLLVIAMLCTGQALAQTTTQNLTLTAGWQAVWLEVEPVYDSGPTAGQPKSPADVFTNTAILSIATPKPLAGLAEFFADDPGSIGVFNQDEWLQWKRTDPSGSNNLGMIQGNRPYLIQVATGTAAFGVPVTGKARFFRPTWTPDRYNLVGFGIEGSVSFDAFFGPSAGRHPVAKIFQLDDAGSWQHVTGPTLMVSNRAYWIYCSGQSDYMGPVSVDFDHAVTGRIAFGGAADAVEVGTGVDKLDLDLDEIVFTNLRSTATVPQLDLITSSAGPGTLALHVVKPATNSLSYIRGNQVDSTPGAGASADLGETIGSQATAVLTLGALRTGTFGAGGRTNLYRLKTGAGSLFWLPVHAADSDLPGAIDPVQPGTQPTSGLWIAEIVVNSSTSIVEDGSPNRETAGSAPIRLIVHQDAGGTVRLLSQVTFMQTRTADPSVPPVPVLVVDPARIPFFEGVKERNGKRVGQRIEAVAYDMPRRIDASSQTTGTGDLLDMIVAESTSPVTDWASGAGLYTTRASVTPAAIESYLLFRSIRPPGLKEVYSLTVPLAGSLAAGQSLTGSLKLDPFHRSNPFRHAFHQQHGKGPQITRLLSLTFDPTQTVTDKLRGTFSETVHGLIKSDLHLSGRFEMRRVSTIATLQGAP
jgi:hypothetical protein